MPSDSHADMKVERLQQLLIAAARQAPPRDDVPHGFEQRIMARLRTAPDPWALWSSWLWRAALSACAVAVVTWGVGLAPWTALPADDLAGEAETPLELASADLENALFAPADSSPEVW